MFFPLTGPHFVGLSNEVAAILLVVVVVFYTLVGGVGGSMYVAYFMTSLVLAVTLVMVSEVFWDPLGMRGVNDDLGSISALYRRLDCGMVSPMAGNDRGSPLTFVSRGGLVNGVLLILGESSPALFFVFYLITIFFFNLYLFFFFFKFDSLSYMKRSSHSI